MADVRTLRKGDRGSEVEELQALLGITADGVFGPDTEAHTRGFQREAGLDADGVVGPKTWGALRQEEKPASAPTSSTSLDTWDGPAEKQPRNRKELYQILGDPGRGVPDKEWAKGNIVWCHPHGNKKPLPGVPERFWVGVHRVVEPYLREALVRCEQVSPYKVHRLGCYVFRHIRHDPARPLSVHSWGAAVDINAQDNRAKTFPRGEAPAAWSEEWNRIWPKGMPEEFVAAFRSCGFAWGSDWDEDGSTEDERYLDSMHFEWVARDGKGNLV